MLKLPKDVSVVGVVARLVELNFIVFFISELQQLRGSQSGLISEELQSMENEAIFQTEKRSLLSVLRDPKLLLPVILVCALQVSFISQFVESISLSVPNRNSQKL